MKSSTVAWILALFSQYFLSMMSIMIGRSSGTNKKPLCAQASNVYFVMLFPFFSIVTCIFSKKLMIHLIRYVGQGDCFKFFAIMGHLMLLNAPLMSM